MRVLTLLSIVVMLFVRCNVSRQSIAPGHLKSLNVKAYLSKIQPYLDRDTLINHNREIKLNNRVIFFNKEPNGDLRYVEHNLKTGNVFDLQAYKNGGTVKIYNDRNPMVIVKDYYAENGKIAQVQFLHSEAGIKMSPRRIEYPIGLKHVYDSTGKEVHVFDYDKELHFKMKDVYKFLKSRNASAQYSAMCEVYDEQHIKWDLFYTVNGHTWEAKMDALSGKFIYDNIVRFIED